MFEQDRNNGRDGKHCVLIPGSDITTYNSFSTTATNWYTYSIIVLS